MRRRRFITDSSRRFICLIILTSVLCGSFPAAAQNRAGAPQRAATPNRGAAPRQNPYDPNAGWSGVVTYAKTLDDSLHSDEPVMGFIDQAKNRVTHDNTHVLKYEGRLFVDGRGPQVVTSAQVTVSDKIDEHGVEKTWGSCGAWKPEHYFIIDGTDRESTEAFAEGPARDFNFTAGFLDGNYHFGFRFPDAKGTYSKESHVKREGHCQPKNNEPSDYSKAEATNVYGEAVSIDGRIDPKNPDVISGSKTWGGEKSGGVKTFKYTVTWSFRRNPAPLEIESVEFDEHPYPDFKSWRKVEGETVDSNVVRVRARVVNYSRETRFPQLKFTEVKANEPLPNGDTSISIAPGETREVEYLWDTAGWAWETGARPASERQIKVDLIDPSGNRTKTEDILIIPRPVILAHGLWADYTAWDGYEKNFYRYHSTSWHSYAVGRDPAHGVMKTGEKGTWKQSNTIIQNAAELEKQVEFVRKDLNAWHVDIVAHSMGGIISRSYINDRMQTVPDGRPAVMHLVMLGTPNMGSPCADLVGFVFWSLQKPVTSLEQLRPRYMEGFNRAVRKRKGVKFSNLVGTPVPQTCQSKIAGDGVVEIPSGVWEVGDVSFSKSVHTNLTSAEDFVYVLRHLAVSHRGDNDPDPKNYAAARRRVNGGRREGEVRFVDATFAAGPAQQAQQAEDPSRLPANLSVTLAKEVTLGPRQSVEIDVPAAGGPGSGVTFIAPPSVSATLSDDKGAVIGRNLAGTPEAKEDFRTIAFGTTAAAGDCKLKLENTADGEASVAVSAWSNTDAVSFVVSAGAPDAAGRVPLQARLSDKGAPVTDAKVTARLVGQDGEIVLYDDGQHGDGAPGDGIYGAATEKLAGGVYAVEAKAETGGETRRAAAGFSVAAASVKSGGAAASNKGGRRQ